MPSRANSSRRRSGSGAAYSTNSKPSVPIGLRGSGASPAIFLLVVTTVLLPDWPGEIVADETILAQGGAKCPLRGLFFNGSAETGPRRRRPSQGRQEAPRRSAPPHQHRAVEVAQRPAAHEREAPLDLGAQQRHGAPHPGRAR